MPQIVVYKIEPNGTALEKPREFFLSFQIETKRKEDREARLMCIFSFSWYILYRMYIYMYNVHRAIPAAISFWFLVSFSLFRFHYFSPWMLFVRSWYWYCCKNYKGECAKITFNVYTVVRKTGKSNAVDAFIPHSLTHLYTYSKTGKNAPFRLISSVEWTFSFFYEFLHSFALEYGMNEIFSNFRV